MWLKESVSQRGRNVFQMGEKNGEKQRGRPSRHWMVVSIQASVSASIGVNFFKFMLALIVLSSITKKREIVTNMAPFRPFRVILVIE